LWDPAGPLAATRRASPRSRASGACLVLRTRVLASERPACGTIRTQSWSSVTAEHTRKPSGVPIGGSASADRGSNPLPDTPRKNTLHELG
jgi:hypothetical protein